MKREAIEAPPIGPPLHREAADLKLGEREKGGDDMAIDANMTPVEVLRLALEREKQALAFYTEAAEQCHHPAAKATFLEIAEEEKRHMRRIEEDLDRYFYQDN
jgi:rubrerythrin